MIDKSFQGFVRLNIRGLDELTRRYAEYRIEVSQSYLDELRKKMQANSPAGYRLEGHYRVLADREQVCGWFRELEISGTNTTVAMCFAFHIPSATLAGGWPLMNNGCWTGIKVWLPANVREAILATARQLSLDTERVDRDWLLWRPWEPLSTTSIEGFHARLTGEDRSKSQDDIVEQLVRWHTDFEKILAAMNKSHE